MSLLVYLILIAAGGLIVGGLARLALPGPDPMSLLQTMFVGIGGSLIAGVIIRVLFASTRIEIGPAAASSFTTHIALR